MAESTMPQSGIDLNTVTEEEAEILRKRLAIIRQERAEEARVTELWDKIEIEMKCAAEDDDEDGGDARWLVERLGSVRDEEQLVDFMQEMLRVAGWRLKEIRNHGSLWQLPD